MRHGKAKPGEIGGRAAERARCHVVEPCRVRRGDEERAPFLLRGIAHGRVLPSRDLHPVGDLQRFLADRLPETQGEAGGGIGHVLA